MSVAPFLASTTPFLASTLLGREGFRHAFFTRKGGVSEGAHSSLNFSATTGDRPENVAENLRRAALAVGVPEGRVFFLSQVHGVEAREVVGADDSLALRARPGDIVLSRAADLACGVRTADCVPLLLADRESGAVAAVHAGWKGVVLGAVAAGVEGLRRLAGPRAPLIAAIGPHISVKSFEVSPEVARALHDVSPDPAVIEMGPRGRPHVNLRRIVAAQLAELGFSGGDVDHVEGCTLSEQDLYFSYRRDGVMSGRLLSVVVAREGRQG